ncbi:MAG: hypothetical protein GY867_03560 [bacterium]|nr:hypothetical protein [bacterium]
MKTQKYSPGRLGDRGGFTLIEIVIIIVTLGILAAVAVPKFADMANSAKVNATKQELMSLKKAIVGDPSAIAGGEYIDRGFEGDIGDPPSLLADLAQKPGSLAVYNPLTRLGWNGPYIDDDNNEYLSDAWGNSYVYQSSARRILSTGGGADTIEVTF